MSFQSQRKLKMEGDSNIMKVREFDITITYLYMSF